MKVPIKFRGRVPDTDKIDGGKIAYGSLVIYTTGMYSHWIYTEGAPRNYPVDPDSVAQLVGYDSKKREVYEGDRVVDKFGEEYIAQLTPTLRENHEGAGIFFRPTERFWVDVSSYGTLTLVE